ncbi:hypothetical protein KCG44_01835 [Pacificimonas sp. WHA3]|uniref:Uncharacterized protein n=1 Tax=Pacificimonas pallii TaxID=2827236 RepID=A0ABS6SAZ5_9SPHN|nr:DUF6607 family protein [Pacificimonas pallii]MBV7255520.1 hypothetical protein [Pacificimonas pallii]
MTITAYHIARAGIALAVALLFSAIALAQPAPQSAASKFEQDRAAILAMAGNFKVDFDFRETVAFTPGYEPRAPYHSGGHEIVRVIEDRGDFISLQHILVVGGEQKFPVKHWRQDWQYQPERVLVFIGGNAWRQRPVAADDRTGSWSQTVYQVDDAPRYGAVGTWSHANGVSEWVPPSEWRPLPRRDMTKREDYHVMAAMNRHAITPAGWVHEQDNVKLALGGEPHVLVREIGVNTYVRSEDFPVEIGDDYWRKTADFWAGVRGIWGAMEARGAPFALTQKGEPERLYTDLLGLAGDVADGKTSAADALARAKGVIARETTTDLPPLARRLRTSTGDGGDGEARAY